MENAINIIVLQLLQFASILLTGLVAGLFYGYDCSVIKGLGNLQDEEYLKAFQSINKVIQNPYFFLSFMGSLVVLPLTSWYTYKMSGSTSFYLFLSATLVYIIGVFGVTIIGNVPLNEQLAGFSLSAATENEISSMRKTFESSWNRYHTVRTIASLIVFCLSILSLLKHKI